MSKCRPLSGLICACAAAGIISAVNARAAGSSQETASNPGLETALAYLQEHKDELGLTGADLHDVVVTSESRNETTGVRHVYLLQRYKGIEVLGTEMTVNIGRDGRVLNIAGAFVGHLPSSINRESAGHGAAAAAEAAAKKVNLKPSKPFELKEAKGGLAQAVVLTDGGVAADGVKARLVYEPIAPRSVRLAWLVEIEEPDGAHYWNVVVDAESGEALRAEDLVVHDDFGVPVVGGGGSPTSFAETMGAVVPDPVSEAYSVFAWPKESPSDGPRTLEVQPADLTASPLGWHDTDGAPGAEFTITRGNNVHAYTDIDANNVPDTDSSPDGGPGLVFDFPLDFTQPPSAYRPAAVTNLFYWNNVVHDVFYRYGFNEVAGNFQVNNYGHGGLGNDDVRAEAQDGSGTNNANFFTPVDGSRPRMQMFVWSSALINQVTVNGGPAAGNYPATGAQFGPPLTTPVTGDVVLVNDGAGVSPTDGCEPYGALPANSIALVDRGNCNFNLKARLAEDSGAIAVIVANNVPGNPITMGAGTPPFVITIPSVMVSQANGTLFKANLPFNATLGPNPGSVPRDSDMDAGVIAHEYGHGISNRLTGGPSVVNCLNNREQMGEGWSDYIALVLTAKAGETATQGRGIGTYVSFQPTTGRGIRPAPYSTDMTLNPVTYGQIGGLAVPHGVGYAWASMLWEVYWNLVAKHGFNPDVRGAWNTGGNNLAIQLVTDGMKLQPCRPGFVDGRNAIVQADTLLTGGPGATVGANYCAIWKGFAKRGLGHSADQGLNTSTTDGTEAFDLPPACLASVSAVPSALASTQVPNTTTTQAFDVKNGSLPDGTDLTWTIAETATSCATPSDLAWLSAAPVGGTTAPGGASTVQVTFDSTGLGIGTLTGKLCITSNGSASPLEVPVSLTVIYDISGFFPPIDNPPAINSGNAGSAIPVKFDLGGDYGFDIFAAGSPASRQADCATGTPIGSLVPATSAGQADLNFGSGQYVFTWKTDQAWANTCRELVVQLNDGTTHTALFSFK